MMIRSQAPTRVDLAGGTLDIWPLYLFHEHAVTVNFAIDVPARCRLEARKDHRISLRSHDTGEQAEFDDPRDLATTPALMLLARLAHFFAPGTGFTMETECAAPPGSGLAGSSALNIAICEALNRFTGSRFSLQELIRIARDVEAQVIRVPTGEQDYYPAAYGGLQAIYLEPGGNRSEQITADLDQLARRLILVYSGRQRDSGINNWEVMKRHIDGDAGVIRAFEGIVAAANRTLELLNRGSFDEMDEALAEEWSHRRTLSPGITTREIDDIVALAMSLGARAAKVCGAGGGGCLILTVPDGRRPEIQERLREHHIHVIDYRIAREGVTGS